MNVAKILLDIEAVKLNAKEPFTFSSGIKSPIYIDNRIIMSYPKKRKEILDVMLDKIKDLEFDVIGGVATAGIHWAAWLAEKLDKPMIYIRDKTKGHGRQNQIEGILKKGQKVLIIEDHISTGGSSLRAIEAVKTAGGSVSDCLAISTYNFFGVSEKFEDYNLITLTDFSKIIDKAVEFNYLDSSDKDLVLSWNKDPKLWIKQFEGLP